jgi:hypothetical protein
MYTPRKHGVARACTPLRWLNQSEAPAEAARRRTTRLSRRVQTSGSEHATPDTATTSNFSSPSH